MSVERPQCSKCQVTRQYERVAPFPEGRESMYGVSWLCPRCQERLLDVCPVGPVVPTENTCLNCGGAFDADGDDPACESCGLTRTQAEASLHVESLPSDLEGAIREAFREGRFRFGLAAANKALLADSSLEGMWIFKTTFLSALGFDQSLAEVLTHKIELGMDSAAISYGALLFREQKYGEAVRVYRTFLDAHPDDDNSPAAMANLANALTALGNNAEAEQLYRAAIEREPDHVTHYINYVYLLRNEGRIDDALGYVDLGLRVSSENGHTVRLLEDRSYLCAEQNRGEDALASIEKALNLGAEGIRARYLHGRALALVGRLKEARKEMQWILKVDPDNEDASRAIRMIDAALRG